MNRTTIEQARRCHHQPLLSFGHGPCQFSASAVLLVGLWLASWLNAWAGLWRKTIDRFDIFSILNIFFILRKGALLFNNVFAIIGGLLEGFTKTANSYEMLIAGRLFIGINCGLNGGLAPMYLSEISPVHLRGAVSHTWHSFLFFSKLNNFHILRTPVYGIIIIIFFSSFWFRWALSTNW